MILSLQYCKFTREQNENAEEWMDHLRINENECGYKEKYWRLIEQLINDIKDDEMMTELIRELTSIKKTNESTNEQVLSCARNSQGTKSPDSSY